ncbi:MAG TPA: PfkB family carbohydrate kinase [Pseudolabrys sp.]|nr:PfkB family carbohydrate kinase [Pseudolabrys sp.]
MADSTRPKPRILCSGIAVHDIVMRVQNFPEPGTKVHASDFIITGGGCAANAAVAIARLGGDTRFAGPLGGDTDAISTRIISDLAAEGINCSGVERVRNGTASVSLILLDGQGEKTIATRRGTQLGDNLPADAQKLVAGVDAVLVDNRFPEFVSAVCRAASTRKIPIVIDLDQRTRLDDPLLALGTHVIASSEASRGSTGVSDLVEALRLLREHLDCFIAITDGPNGVHWLERNDVRHMPAFRIEAVDSLAAGDIFHGAFTLALAEGRNEVEAMQFGSAAAALKCMRFGGASGAPTRAQVDDFLNRHPVGCTSN